jgi:hypothetical protein
MKAIVLLSVQAEGDVRRAMCGREPIIRKMVQLWIRSCAAKDLSERALHTLQKVSGDWATFRVHGVLSGDGAR